MSIIHKSSVWRSGLLGIVSMEVVHKKRKEKKRRKKEPIPAPPMCHPHLSHSTLPLLHIIFQFPIAPFIPHHQSSLPLLVMLLIGLTGSIATGKSTVANILSSPPHSLPLIDADLLARQAVRPGTRAYASIVKYFSPTTPDLLSPSASDSSSNPPGERGRPLNRAALGRRVFGSTSSRVRDRRALNAIVHPAVRLLMLRAILSQYVCGRSWAIVLDIPLLFESGLDIFCGAVVVVGVSSPEVQMQRLRARDTALSAEEARERVGSQMSVAEKVDRCRERGTGAGHVVWNDESKEELQVEVARVVKELEQGRGWHWRWWLWASPIVAAMWAVLAVWNGWRARKRWDRREKRSEKNE